MARHIKPVSRELVSAGIFCSIITLMQQFYLALQTMQKHWGLREKRLATIMPLRQAGEAEKPLVCDIVPGVVLRQGNPPSGWTEAVRKMSESKRVRDLQGLSRRPHSSDQVHSPSGPP
jgi:hypothetical protein